MSGPATFRTLFVTVLWTLACACADRGASAPVQPPASPQRIVSLAPALTEVLFALGAGERVVGVTDYCDYPPEVRALPKVGGYVNPSVETVLSLRPDLVIVSPAAGNREPAKVLERAGARVEVVPMETLAETFTAIATVARLVGREDAGTALAASVRARLDAAAQRHAGAKPVRTLFCVQVEPVIAAGAGTLPSEILELAGGSNVIAAPRYPQVGMEAILEQSPEVILQAKMDTADTGADAAAAAFWRRWPAIPAVRDGRVVVFDASTALRPGPRVADAVERIAEILHAHPAGTAR